MGPPKNNDISSLVAPPGGKQNDAPTKGGGANTTPEVRHKMKQYWEVYAPSIESMMLSHDAPHLSVEEQKEVMSYLPQQSYVGKKVLELGAGIGRYTSLLTAAGAGHLTAVDFMESYITENRRVNGHRENVTMLCADVTKLNYQPHSFDLVFSNWLLMYLTDSEVESLLQRALSWLKPGGYLFIRESCYHQSGNLKRGENPTLYRSPLDYTSVLSTARADGASYRLLKTKNIHTYIKNYRNPNQLCFLARQEPPLAPATIVAEVSSRSNTRLVESNDRMTTELQRIVLREAIKGKTWYSEGGKDISKMLLSRLGPLKGKSVLADNCDSAGLPFLLAQQGAARVHGVATTAELLHCALRHQGAAEPDILSKTSFEMCPQSEWLAGERFDLICAEIASLSAFDGVFEHYKSLLTTGGKLQLVSYTAGEAHGGARNLVQSSTLQSLARASGLQSVTVQHSSAMLQSLTLERSALQGALRDPGRDQLRDVPQQLRQDYLQELNYKIDELTEDRMTWSIIECHN